MEDINLTEKINQLITLAEEAEEFELAKALSYLQVEIIEERTRLWEEGYQIGYSLAMREFELRRLGERIVMKLEKK